MPQQHVCIGHPVTLCSYHPPTPSHRITRTPGHFGGNTHSLPFVANMAAWIQWFIQCPRMFSVTSITIYRTIMLKSSNFSRDCKFFESSQSVNWNAHPYWAWDTPMYLRLTFTLLPDLTMEYQVSNYTTTGCKTSSIFWLKKLWLWSVIYSSVSC